MCKDSNHKTELNGSTGGGYCQVVERWQRRISRERIVSSHVPLQNRVCIHYTSVLSLPWAAFSRSKENTSLKCEFISSFEVCCKQNKNWSPDWLQLCFVEVCRYKTINKHLGTHWEWHTLPGMLNEWVMHGSSGNFFLKHVETYKLIQLKCVSLRPVSSLKAELVIEKETERFHRHI